jgi:hypothetical protein
MATKVEFEEIIRFLREEGLNIAIGPLGTAFTKISGKNGDYRLIVRFIREKEIIVVYMEYQFTSDLKSLDEVMKLSSRINWGLLFSTCEVDEETGSIRFRSTVLTDEASFNSSQFTTSLATASTLADNYSPVFKSVIYGGLTAKEALEKVGK